MKPGWFRHLGDLFGRDTRGSVAVLMALGVPVLIGAAGTALDLSRWQNEKSRAQSAADSAALATVREVAAIGNDPKRMNAIAEQVAKSNVGSMADRIRVTSVVPPGATNALQVIIEMTSEPGMSRILGMG
ncbi:MAG: TadE/TadG family type IV pilus assembly protein, partial [Beijerinckiaceae bacterium]